MNMNKVILVGRLAGTPKYDQATEKSQSKLFFHLAVNRIKSEKADFIPVTTWGKSADAGAQFLTKGKEVTVEGRLRFDSVVQEDGSYKNFSGVVADYIVYGQDSKKTQEDREAGVVDTELAANKLLAAANKAKKPAPASLEDLAKQLAALLAAQKGQPAPEAPPAPAGTVEERIAAALVKRGVAPDVAATMAATQTASAAAATDGAVADVDIPF